MMRWDRERAKDGNGSYGDSNIEQFEGRTKQSNGALEQHQQNNTQQQYNNEEEKHLTKTNLPVS